MTSGPHRHSQAPADPVDGSLHSGRVEPTEPGTHCLLNPATEPAAPGMQPADEAALPGIALNLMSLMTLLSPMSSGCAGMHLLNQAEPR